MKILYKSPSVNNKASTSRVFDTVYSLEDKDLNTPSTVIASSSGDKGDEGDDERRRRNKGDTGCKYNLVYVVFLGLLHRALNKLRPFINQGPDSYRILPYPNGLLGLLLFIQVNEAAIRLALNSNFSENLLDIIIIMLEDLRNALSYIYSQPDWASVQNITFNEWEDIIEDTYLESEYSLES